jgi:hypothetical protein
MNSNIFYTAKPIKKKVTKQEFQDFLNNYPRKLTKHYCGISDPPSISYNDFKLSDCWPDSVVANTWEYSDKPGDYYYEPEEKRRYYIVENYEELFESRTINKEEQK